MDQPIPHSDRRVTQQSRPLPPCPAFKHRFEDCFVAYAVIRPSRTATKARRPVPGWRPAVRRCAQNPCTLGHSRSHSSTSPSSSGRTSMALRGPDFGAPCMTTASSRCRSPARRTAKATHIEGVLEQPDASRFGPPLDHGRHQVPTDAWSLHLWSGGEPTDSSDRPTLIEEIGSDDPSVGLGDDAPDPPVHDEVVSPAGRPPLGWEGRAGTGDSRGGRRTPHR